MWPSRFRFFRFLNCGRRWLGLPHSRRDELDMAKNRQADLQRDRWHTFGSAHGFGRRAVEPAGVADDDALDDDDDSLNE